MGVLAGLLPTSWKDPEYFNFSLLNVTLRLTSSSNFTALPKNMCPCNEIVTTFPWLSFRSCCSLKVRTIVLDLKEGSTFELISENKLEGRIQASPAVAGNELFIRTETDLYKIAE